MNIALIGYGKMGREIEEQAKKLKHNIVLKIDNQAELKDAFFDNVDIAIDFSVPKSAINNIDFLAKKGISIVVGTTGWYDQIDKVKKIVEEHNIGFLWAANFSLGVNIFWKILEHGGKIVDKFDEYDVFGHEYHHNQKKDSPSGTAIKTGEILIENIKRKDTLQVEKLDREPLSNELHFSSTRGGSVLGAHSVFFDSLNDTIEITHTARNRCGFALGAVKTAEWLDGKKGYFEMNDYIDSIIK